jgi:hypothetical protein
MNKILNIYSEQLNIFSLIDTVINTDYDTTEMKELFASIINDNIKEYTYKQLNFPFTKLDLINKALTEELSIPSILEETSNDTLDKQVKKRFREDDHEQLGKRTKNIDNNIPSEPWMINSKKDTSIPVYGGLSLKNKRNLKINYTKNNKIKNNKQTIKFKNIKVKRNTRRH